MWDNIIGTTDKDASEQARDEYYMIPCVHEDWLTDPEVNQRTNNNLYNEVRRRIATE